MNSLRRVYFGVVFPDAKEEKGRECEKLEIKEHVIAEERERKS